ncbi:hypothetical protein A2697_03335 [Candidatus Curtissbacteria bacterium RIFCSPHIGHO2_01_FULL_41_44]|uniref:Glycosyl transferase family 1 domain-containing protein n=1 Tax=Candidatus Curtissbacteria bacterium RIFCSPLOWO2_01_FULL_42_50 TaxID=1797730 RepID=A0A1F5H4Y3_9BACT|nr:MAG: hypothetical protein A3C33_00210 [Candidatus Curtissbacteria bacterium RIFCSPHIGHO2_02_FULL_42_58]OGD93591.1 MAG: hypothetical protein A2697_03335 [Candidatus Curtissbacteria bacterium RIFCSPHIGHO2_01_FULL_41_44]OGD97352.1 MAG: hypothetical protein A3E71_04090 [Candidatus Curtissbacteria bacterium RIFCSPHIGHO2_12_FULL_42_33]OGD99232.1 MAG: hypothetical protein A3B54_01530 [Candidatus Curtissbacteria bacterium RIFCSPLOWO2_01_FULL_42_50]OGE03558.1 MAG: hypothetical protein A3G16_00765 [Ca
MTKKQNLVVLASPFVTSKGLAGGDLYYIELADYLAKKYKVSVITPQFAKVHWRGKNVRLLTLEPNIFDESEKRIFLFAAYIVRSIQAYFLLTKFPAKTIVCSSSEFLPDILPIFLSKIRGKNYFWVARFYHLVSLSNKNVNKLFNCVSFLLQRLSIFLAIKKASLILIDNQKTAIFLKSKGVKNNRLLTSGGSIDIKKIQKFLKNRKRHYDAVFAGRLDYVKGVFDLPEIWARVVSAIPRARLAIVGTATTQNQKRLQKIIEENHIEKNVDLLGFLPHTGKKTIFDVFVRSKIFVSLTLEGGRDFTLIESMACGLPAVCYEQPFLNEGTIKKGFLLAQKSDRKKIAQLIIYLLENREVRSRLSREAEEEVKKLDWRKTYASLSTFLSRLS